MIRELALLLFLFPTIASAANSCVSRPEGLATLAEKYKETRQAIGLDTRGTVMEIYSSADGAWSLVVTRPDGSMCMVASGVGFELTAEPHGEDM